MSSKKPDWLKSIEEKVTRKVDEIVEGEIKKFKQEFDIEDVEFSYTSRYPFVQISVELPVQIHDMKREIFITTKRYDEDLGFEELNIDERGDILERLSELDKMLIEEISNKFKGEAKVYKNTYGTIYIVIRYNKYSIRVVKTDIDC